MDKNKNNVSFFMYTALIFIVAIIMVILAFLGQNNIHKNQQTNITGNTITDNVAKLSEDNAHLHEDIFNANQKIAQYESDIKIKNETITAYESVISAYMYEQAGNFEEADKIISSVNKELLSGDILIIYEKITQRTGETE